MSQAIVTALRAVLSEIALMKLDRLHPLSIQAQHAEFALQELQSNTTPLRLDGEWSSDNTIVELCPGHRVAYVHRAAEVVAQVWRPAGGTDADTLVLARQIAANPNLLAACEAVHDADGDRASVNRAERMVASAIAKAGYSAV